MNLHARLSQFKNNVNQTKKSKRTKRTEADGHVVQIGHRLLFTNLIYKDRSRTIQNKFEVTGL